MTLKTIRKILTPFLIIPLAMIGYVFIFPNLQWENSGLELLFLVIGVPILIFNFLAWFPPEFVRAYFPLDENWGQGTDEKLLALVKMTGAFLAFILLGVGTASAINRVSVSPTLAPTQAQLAEVPDFPTFAPLPPRTPAPNATPTLPPEMVQVPVSGGETTTASEEQTGIPTEEVFTPTLTITPDPIFAISEPMQAGKYAAADPHIVYEGNWIIQGPLIVSNTVGNYLGFSFIGRQMILGYQGNSNAGDMNVNIDGSDVTITQLVGNAWFSEELEPGTHFVILKHENGGSVNLEYIEITG